MLGVNKRVGERWGAPQALPDMRKKGSTGDRDMAWKQMNEACPECHKSYYVKFGTCNLCGRDRQEEVELELAQADAGFLSTVTNKQGKGKLSKRGQQEARDLKYR